MIGFLFCIEYLCRLWVSPLQHRYGRGLKGVIRYMLSPLAVIDAVAIFPTFIGALGSQFYVLRVIRLLRIAKVGRSKRFQQSVSHFNYAIVCICSSFSSKSYRTTSHSNGSSQSTLTEI